MNFRLCSIGHHGIGAKNMATKTHLSYENWRQSRIHSAKVAGIDVLFQIVSNNLLATSGEELLNQVYAIEDYETQSADINSTELALKMRGVLDTILPEVLESPKWLTDALNDFTDSEIIDLYNAIMHGAGAKWAGAGTQKEKVEFDDIDDVPF